MNEFTSTDAAGPADEILAEIMRELESAGTSAPAVHVFVARHPEFEAEIREFFSTLAALERTQPPTEPPIPKQLGEFTILRRVARGGMGDVYEAIQQPLNRQVAVKTIRHGRISPEREERFLREQEVLAQLHQTNIVPIHTAGREGDLQYFAMPFIEGAALNHVVRIVLELGISGETSSSPSLAGLVVQVDRDTPASDPSESTFVPAEGDDSTPPKSGGQLTKRTIFSTSYHRSVAETMADVADAVEYAHGEGILHRDLKPSNLMVDRDGHCWIIDFGLAGFVRDSDEEDMKEAEQNGHRISATGIIGTPSYMAPEQFNRDSLKDQRTDVWGLGATLYELLALQAPFSGESQSEIEEQVCHAPIIRPRAYNNRLPRDLEAICLKALRKSPEQRYQSAQEFADDLRRWLRDEPVTARPARAPRRVWKWSRRNKGWATAILIALPALIGAVALPPHILLIESQTQQHIRERMRIRLTDRSVGWSDRAVGTATEFSHSDESRDHVAATLIGLDATITKKFDFGASALAFDRDGTRLFMGGLARDDPAKLWAGGISEPRRSAQGGAGPVGFTDDGTPVQVVLQPNGNLLLWDSDAGESLRELRIPENFEVEPSNQDRPGAPYEITATPNLSHVALAGTDADGGHSIAVWDAGTGDLLHVLTHSLSEESKKLPKSALEFAPDGSLLALGDRSGQVVIWSLQDGNVTARLSAGRNGIESLTFCRNPFRSRTSLDEAEKEWLLATGDAGGTVVIWDLRTTFLKNILRGSHFNVFALAFSPDGTLLASGGRNRPRLWDVATGKLLLELGSADYATDLLFSPDGGRLVVTNQHVFGAAKTTIWEVDYGRGTHTFRGLSGNVQKICLSPDETRLAAFTHEWEIGVWDTGSGRLLHALEAPQGFLADNSAIAFDEQGRHLAVSTWAEADLWDLEEGKRIQTWNLPYGIADTLVFRPTGELLSLRKETQTGEWPLSDVSPQDSPRVCRLRNLLGEQPLKPIAEIREFNWHVFNIRADRNGDSFFVDGLHRDAAGDRHTIRAFDALTGAERWSMPSSYQGGLMLVGPTGAFIAAQSDAGAEFVVLEAPTKGHHGRLPSNTVGLGPDAKMFAARRGRDDGGGYSLLRWGDTKPLVTLGIDEKLLSPIATFSRDGQQFLWGNADGTVVLCDLSAIDRTLSEYGIGW